MQDGLNFFEIMMGVLYGLGAMLSIGVVFFIIMHYVNKKRKASKTKDFVTLEPMTSEFVNGTFDLLFENFTDKQIKLELTDFDGNTIEVLTEGMYEEGIHRVKFDTTKYPNNTYFYKLTTNNQSLNKKMKIKNI
mgnify:CR=1 FL=1